MISRLKWRLATCAGQTGLRWRLAFISVSCFLVLYFGSEARLKQQQLGSFSRHLLQIQEKRDDMK
jgi:hypothetical protein